MADDPHAVLLQEMLSATGEKPTMQNLLAQVAETNPTLAPFANYLVQREAQRREQEANEAAEITVEQVPDRRESLQKLELTVKKLYRELEELRGRNDAMAAALGACYLCWGDDLECPLCRGSGASGWHAPDQAFFDHWVVPAARLLQLRRKAASRSDGGGQAPNGKNPRPDSSLR